MKPKSRRDAKHLGINSDGWFPENLTKDHVGIFATDSRLNGIITPCRPMTMEALAGKSHSTHPGIIDQITEAKIANAVASRRNDVKNCECYLVSQIGSPVTAAERSEESSSIHRNVSLRS